MSAIPEQVEQPTIDEILAGTTYICADPTAHKVCHWMVAFAREFERKEAEFALLAAEARVREVEAERDARRERKVALMECEEREAALRAERDALRARVREVEAAFKKYGDHWDQCPAVTPRRKCNCGYDQARAILAREET